MRFGATLRLAHVREGDQTAPSSLREYVGELERASEQSLSVELDIFRGNDIDVSYEALGAATPFHGIRRAVEAVAPDLVVMGTRPFSAAC